MAVDSPPTLEELVASVAGLEVDDDRYWRLVDDAVATFPASLADLSDWLKRSQTDEVRSLLADLVGRLAERAPDGVPPLAGRQLRAWLGDSTTPTALTAVLAGLRRLGVREALQEAVSLAGHPSSAVREQLAQTLPALMPAEGADVGLGALRALTEDPNSQVREWAVHGLATAREWDDERVRDVLRERVADLDGGVRCEALRGLARGGSREYLVAFLRECDPDQEILQVAAAAHPDRELHEVLRAVGRSDWVGDRELLARTIESSRPRGEPVLLERLSRELDEKISELRDPHEEYLRLVRAKEALDSARGSSAQPGSRRPRGSRGGTRSQGSSGGRSREGSGTAPSAAVQSDARENIHRQTKGAGAMAREERHIVPNPEGGWDVTKPGASRASSHHDTQSQAEARAKEIVGNAGGGEAVIHGRDGRVRDSDTVAPGNDPNPPRDRKH